MDWGMKNRLSRIIKPSTGHAVMLAVDHGYFMGPTHKLEEPRKTIEPLLPYADAIMCTRGVLRTSVDPKTNVPIVLRVSGGASVIGDTLTNEATTTSFKDAIRLNVAAVALSIFVGTQHEHQTLRNLGHLVNLGEDYGIPVLAVTAVGKELEKRDDLLLRRFRKSRQRMPCPPCRSWRTQARNRIGRVRTRSRRHRGRSDRC